MRIPTRLTAAIGIALSSAGAASGQRPPPPPPGPTIRPGELNLPRQPARLKVIVMPSPRRDTAYSGEPFDGTVSLSVTNTGEQSGNFYVVARLAPGSTDQPRSGPWSVGPGARREIAFRIQAWMRRTAIQGNALPITVALVAADGRDLAATQFSIPFLTRISPLPQAVMARLTATPNLELERAEVAARVGIGSRRIGSRGGRAVSVRGFVDLRLTATVRHTTAAGRWGYPARVTFFLRQGTPETGFTLLGADGHLGNAVVPGNLAPNERRYLPHLVEWAGYIRPGLWYTLDATIWSEADTDHQDDVYRAVFMYNDDGYLVEQRGSRGPPPAVRVRVVAP